MKYDIGLLKSLLPDYLRNIGCEIKYRGETKLSTACPIHGGEKQNFHAIQKPDGVWRWTCFSGCGGDGGTILDLHSKLNGGGIREAIIGAAEALHIAPDETGSFTPASTAESARRRREAKERELAAELEAAMTGILQKKLHKKLETFLDDNWRQALDVGTLVSLENRRHDSHLFIESLFSPEDNIWMGEIGDSGREMHRENFRHASDWMLHDRLPPRVSAGTFKDGSFGRTAGNVDDAPFIVIESDSLIGYEPTTGDDKEKNKAFSFALFFYCQERLGLTPRAVIDTGNKSLHLWFDRPPPDDMEALVDIAEGFRMDRGLLEKSANSPLRLPGTIHKNGNKAELLFINPKHDTNSK